MYAMPALLEGSLGRVSDECRQRYLISQETYHKTVDAAAGHATHHIFQILLQIEQQIDQDPKNLEVFIKAVLEPMGDYAAKLITKLRK